MNATQILALIDLRGEIIGTLAQAATASDTGAGAPPDIDLVSRDAGRILRAGADSTARL